jgi:uncharacterized protein (DUF952 family)
MAQIFHIVPRSTWEKHGTGAYRAGSLATEGFIHCSYEKQVAWVANSFYRQDTDLVVLAIDPERLRSPVRAEDPGIGESFPHVYGPIDFEAIVAVRSLRRDASGEWEFPPETANKTGEK